MRFRPRQQPPPFLNRRDQWRLLGLVGGLMVVVVAIRWAARPDSWNWMFPQAADQTQPADQQPPAPVNPPVRPDPVLKDGEFLAVPQDPAVTHTVDDADSLQVNPARFRAVRDRTMGIRRVEAQAYFDLLQRLQQFEPQQIDSAAEHTANYTVLMTEPAYYRGRLISIQGTIKRLTEIPAAANPHGIDHIYDIWMLTPDSGAFPVHVRTLEVPDGIPRGQRISQDVQVRVNGYFFKVEGFAAEGGLRTTPLVLARTVQWTAPGTANERTPDVNRTLLIFLGAVVFAVIGLLWSFRRSDRRFQQSDVARLAERATEQPPPANLDGESPQEFLERLAEADAQDQPPG